jgi:hypothetical protein
MSLFGVTALEISPHLHLHYEPKSGFCHWICCGGKDNPGEHDNDTQYYIDRKNRVKLANGTSGNDGVAATSARLKLIVVEALVPYTSHPFHNAERVYKLAGVSWEDPARVYKDTLLRIDAAFERVKHEVLENPLELDDGQEDS